MKGKIKEKVTKKNKNYKQESGRGKRREEASRR
jgi:hypothetical protein